MSFFGKAAKLTPADRKVVFTGFTDHTMPGSIRKFCLGYINCSTSERSVIEKELQGCGVKRGEAMFGIQGHDELKLIFPNSWEASDSCGAYLKSIAVEIECPANASLENIVGSISAYPKAQT